ncbi:MAG TPA: sugar ABC transporter permease [Trueperaceae bacterium]|nr:sugar ABC transporter permease [Trueperaceae bacterium]
MDLAVAARLNNLYWSLGTVAFIVLGSYLVGRLAMSISAARGAGLLQRRRVFWGYALASPWLLGFVIFVLGPAVLSLYYSFTDYKLGRPIEWIGLDNYRSLLAGAGAYGRRFVQAMYNSAYYAIVGVPLQIATALLMAVLVAQPLRGMAFFRLVFYVPVILAGGPAILLAWRYMLASNGGFINVTLKRFAEMFPPFDWLYRSFIFVVESFNAFFIGVSRADPVGPLMYTIPALLGFGACLALFLTASEATRHTMARTLVEIGGAILLVFLAVRAITGGSFVPRVLGRLGTLFDLITQRSSLRAAGDLDYLTTGYAAQAPSALWLLAVLVGVAAIVGYGRGASRQRWLLGVVGALFGLLAIGATTDGVRYFAAYDAVAAATGAANHHFALFRQVVAQFPDANRVPLWLSSELWSKPSLVLITMWSSGAGMLIFLAALKGVPRSLYEAASVDGATGWQKFKNITMPMISPAMFYNVVIGLIAALQTFEAVYIIQNTLTEQSIASAAYFLFVRTFRQLEIAQGAAASWILAVLIVLLTVAQFRYSRWVHYE